MAQAKKTFTGFITELKPNQIFVFGSNPEGRHGAGTAYIAVTKYGAQYGFGRGLKGQTYGLVTTNLSKNYTEPATGILYRDTCGRSVTKEQIVANIRDLYTVAQGMADKEFLIAYTAAGRNLNGYTSPELAVMFKEAGDIPGNIVFEDRFSDLVYGD